MKSNHFKKNIDPQNYKTFLDHLARMIAKAHVLKHHRDAHTDTFNSRQQSNLRDVEKEAS